MACLKGPTILPPVFPTGITLPTIVLPFPSSIDLCCRLTLPFPSSISLPPIPIPGGILATIEQIFDAVNQVLDQLQINCPLD